jgi:hypothetical protein
MMARVRSPNFPILSLPQAVERIETIYDREQTVPADPHTIANHLGYSGLNGASLKMISALRKYGLLEVAGPDAMRVSALAMTIMHPASDGEKREALREAANGPALFRQLNDVFGGQRPSETNLRSWLLRNGFAKSAVDNVIKAYGETMDLVGGPDEGYRASVPAVVAALEKRPSMHYGGGTAVAVAREASEPFSVELLKGRIRVVGELSNREDARTLLNFLNTAIGFLPETKAANEVTDDETTEEEAKRLLEDED